MQLYFVHIEDVVCCTCTRCELMLDTKPLIYLHIQSNIECLRSSADCQLSGAFRATYESERRTLNFCSTVIPRWQVLMRI